MDIFIIYILIITFSVLYIAYINLSKSKSTTKHILLPFLISENTDNSLKTVCVPKYLQNNSDVIKKVLILEWLKENGNNVTTNEPIVKLLIGRLVYEGTVGHCGKLFITKQKNEIVSGGCEICKLFLGDEKHVEHNDEHNCENRSIIAKYSFVLEMPYIDGLKASSIKITKWHKKSGDHVREKEIISSHIINECKKGVDHALKTGIIKIYKSENDYIKEGELVYEISSDHDINKIAQDFNPDIQLESNININEQYNLINNEKSGNQDIKYTFTGEAPAHINGDTKINRDGNNIYHKIELLKNSLDSNSYSEKDTINLLEELLIKEELRVILYRIALKIIGSERNTRKDKTFEEYVINPEKNATIDNKEFTNIKYEDVEDKNIIDVSNYDVSINSVELTAVNVPGDNNIEVTKSTPSTNFVTGKELLDLKNDIFNLYETKISRDSNNEPDDKYTDNKFSLNNFWLKLPRKYSNTFTDSIKQSETLIDDIYLKIINIYDSLFKEGGTDILRALKLSNKNIATLEKIREEEMKQGYSIYYYNNSSYYNKILNIFYYTHRTAQLLLKLKYGFKVNVEDNLFILSDLGLESYRMRIKNLLNELIKDIPNPDFETEVEINKLNTTRWKVYYNDIKEKKDSNKYDKMEILNSIKMLISQNRKNYNLKNIYYSAAKLLIDISILDSSYYFALYRILSVRYGVEAKPVPSVLKKRIIKCGNDTFIEYEKILIGSYNLNTKRDNKKLLNDILKLFKKERKIIDIDKSKIATAEEEHLRIKNKLDQLLSYDEQLHNEKGIVKTVRSLKNSTSKSNEVTPPDNVQRELLQIMIEKENALSENELKIFAQKFKLPYNYLINSVNEYFYDMFDDNIIIEEDTSYLLNSDYYDEIKKIIYYGEI